MKKLIAILSLAVMPMTSMAAGGPAVALEKANIDLHNEAAIQRGAKMFVNHCMGCHSAKYVRNQLMMEQGLTETQIRENLMPGGGKVGDLMTIAMPEDDAAEWFGAAAPDLTNIARIKTGKEDWIYTYMKSFYSDPSRPMGVNNTVFPNVGMPNVLWKLQGIQEAVFRYDVSHDGQVAESFDNEADAVAYAEKNGEGYTLKKVVDRLEMTQKGTMTPAEFDASIRDLSTYLAYISEPMKVERMAMGVKVLIFLLIFSILAYMMKKEWWKEIH